MTAPSQVNLPLQFSPIVLPLHVMAFSWTFPALMSSAMTAGRPPARKYSSPRYSPAGCMLTRSGISKPILSQSSQVSSSADMLGDRVDVDRRIGRAADRRVGDDGVLERLARDDVGGLHVLPDHLDGAPAGVIGHLATLAVGSGDGGRARQGHAERLGKRIHRRGSAHRVAMADRGSRRADEVDELLVVELAGGVQLARLPGDGAGAGPLAFVPSVEHRADIERDRRKIDGRCRHDAGRHRLVAARQEDDPVERVAVEDLDKREVGEIAVEAGGRALAGLLDRVARKLERHAAGDRNSVTHALGQLDMVAVAGRQVGPGLSDADDRLLRLQFLLGQPVIEISLEIERRHPRIFRIVEPQTGTKFVRRTPPRPVSHSRILYRY